VPDLIISLNAMRWHTRGLDGHFCTDDTHTQCFDAVGCVAGRASGL